MKKLFRNLTGALLITALFGVFTLSSCKKDDKDNKTEKLTEEQINQYADISNTISTKMQSAAIGYMSKAFESGFTGELPNTANKKSGTQLSTNNSDWLGPDAQGWYYRTWDGVYKYTEKLRTRKDTVDHIYSWEANGADAQYKYEITTQYVRYTKNNKDYYKGYTEIDEHSSGYNNISQTFWKMEFKDWDPSTGAGIFDWYWGVPVNNGGDTIPTHKYFHIDATPTSNNMLHVHVIIYDENGSEIWDYEYDTPFEPVNLSE